jgi:autophagy-related protein 16-1
LHDEINTLQLELGQIDERNQILIKDNAKLLQRWLDAKQAEVNKMNEVNEFYEDMQTRKQAAMNSKRGSAGNSEVPSSTSESGNGESKRSSGSTMMKDGTPSHGEKDLSLTPNG